MKALEAGAVGVGRHSRQPSRVPQARCLGRPVPRGRLRALLALVAAAAVAGSGFLALRYSAQLRPLRVRRRFHGCGAAWSPNLVDTPEGGGLAPGEGTSGAVDGVVYTCWGEGCDVPLLCTSLLLLRPAGYYGPVYVVTDDAREAAVRTLCPEAAFAAVAAPGAGSVMEMKNFKRRLFEIVPGPPRSLLFLDADILPVGCLDPFLRTLQSVESVGMFRDTWCKGCNVFCTGAVFMRDLPATRRCWRAWDRELSRENYGLYSKEQDALDVVLEQGQCADIEVLPNEFMQSVDRDFLWTSLDILRMKWPTFQHFTHKIRGLGVWPTMFQRIERQMRPYMPHGWASPTERLIKYTGLPSLKMKLRRRDLAD